jgi:hypothetical protein
MPHYSSKKNRKELSKLLEEAMKKRISRWKIIVGLMAILGVIFLSLASFPAQDRRAQLETKDLRREIQIINLVNGLELSPAQKKIILNKALQSQQWRQEAQNFYLSKEAELNIILETIKNLRLENKEVPPELARQFHQLEDQLKKQKVDFQEKIASLAQEIEKALEPHQLYALHNYVPCVIPPKGESRIGQAVDVQGIGRRLAHLRSLPDPLYQRRKHDIINQTIEGIKLKTGFIPDEATTADLTAKLGDFYDRLRNLSEVDFEIKKEALAKEFMELTKPKLRPLDIRQKIEIFLLAPEIISVLEAKPQGVQGGN